MTWNSLVAVFMVLGCWAATSALAEPAARTLYVATQGSGACTRFSITGLAAVTA
jgi:hypothetical protein